ncbi:5-formyltetrahydrofolate cyclo-ligase [Robertkochia marina]|uniref:5-formyltetrahydrofolate cyclo-ligase n=1 Tax=Robertkochia marina TaxID=1227945 RepID=A0A4S3M401_9FLAO|nr:5-formyltetrahydrofolate cyclo-ligase [Robertkochia marina]THD69505.1 5-formyltetrahydrofolate cyclo-ligase [Robertkochia marina]TRZ47236.1 5-formyltetrahydrofolate cyclo-ligase [Robertkochia marina]
MDKHQLRTKYKEKRKVLKNAELEDLSIEITNQALRSPIWDHATYHLFLPIERQHEIDTSFLLTVLQGKDKEVIISRSDFNNGSMKHFLLTDNTVMKTNSYGIPEPQSGIEIAPAAIEVVFVPLLAYDRFGNRVGYGKGFYDRFLKECNPDTLKIGLSFFPPEDKINDVNQDDIALDMCITPEGVYDFRN